jgi:uncharacterized protein (DUF1501 family)
MYLLQPHEISRRAFLRRSAQLAITGTALPTALNLAAIGEAAAFNATDYKALVCIFLYGGNDYANTVVPYDSARYGQYAQIRGDGRTDGTASGIALAYGDLAATVLKPKVALGGGVKYALHPKMTGVAGLFNSGRAALLLNVGPLVVPLTRAQYSSRSQPVPPKLFSHNDQQSVWQASAAEGAAAGWGGRMGDLALSSNARSMFTCMSITGNAVFLSGNSTIAYRIGASGAVKIRSVTSSVYQSAALKQTMSSLVQHAAGNHFMERAYAAITERSVGAEVAVSSALGSAGADGAAYSPFTPEMLSSNSLAGQLKMVARLIAARETLGAKRQVFFVSLGSFDHHDNLLTGHSTLLERLSQAVTAFQQSMVNLGVSNQVTAFTASDFGRTLTSNGDGSDHGWGSHHFVVGGAVKGKAFYGRVPPLSVTNSTTDANDQWHVGSGRLLPSTSVDQYAATLARWFGVSESELPDVLPHLSNFGGTDYPTNLGFLPFGASSST